VIQQKDTHELRLHVTVQNKVPRAEALALQRDLSASFRPRSFRFPAFGLYCWDGELWIFAKRFAFRG